MSASRVFPFFLCLLAAPAGAQEMGAVVATEASGVSEALLGRILAACDDAIRATPLRLARDASAAEVELRRSAMNPRACAAAPACISKLGGALSVQYVVAVGVASFGGLQVTVDVVDVARAAAVGHASGPVKDGDLTRPVAALVREALPARFTRPLGLLAVTANVNGANVSVDGDRVGRTPIQSLEVPAGPHRVVVEFEDWKEYQAEVTVEAGKSTRVEAELLPPAGGQVTRQLSQPPPPPLTPEEAPVRGMKVGAYVAAGTSVAALAAGIGFVLAMKSNERSFYEACNRELTGRSLPGSCEDLSTLPLPDTGEMRDYRDASERAGTISTVAFAVAGAAAVTAGVLLLLDSPPQSPAALRVAPVPGGAALALAGRF